MFASLGRVLMWLGGGLFFLGLLFVVVSRIPGVGRLPGDVTVQRGNFTLYVPLGTMIVLSLALTLLLNLIFRLRR